MKADEKKKEGDKKAEEDTTKNQDPKKKANDGKEQEDNTKKEPELKPQIMPKGDYQIHILLEEVRKMETKSER
jgi:hypothetical protein